MHMPTKSKSLSAAWPLSLMAALSFFLLSPLAAAENEPSEPGDLVKMNTVDFPRSPILKLSYGTSFGSTTTFKDFADYPGGSRDWLGFDDGTGSLPSGVPNQSLNFMAGNTFGKLGVVLALSHGNKWHRQEEVRNYFRPAGQGELSPLREYEMDYSTRSILTGITANFAYELTDNNRIQFQNFFSDKDDGIEMFGGTANIKHALLTGVADDSLDYTEGCRGSAQFICIQQDKSDADNGFEFDSNGDANDLSPDFRPMPNSMALDVNYVKTLPENGFFSPVTCAGCVGPNDDWTHSWSTSEPSLASN